MSAEVVKLATKMHNGIELMGPIWPNYTSVLFDLYVFPHITNYVKETSNHPFLSALKSGKNVTNVVICEEWEDYHQTCYNLIVTIDNVNYGVSVWWLSGALIRMLPQAEGGKESALLELTQELTKELTQVLKQFRPVDLLP